MADAITESRMAFLALIRDGKVKLDRFATWRRYEHVETHRELTARTADAMARGWAMDGPLPERATAVRLVVLAPKGKQVLAEWEKSRNV